MIDLNSAKLVNNIDFSSKGNQLKWNDNGHYYKVDNNGYEGLSEFVVSELLKHSSLNKNEFVEYQLQQFEYKQNIYSGCESKNFLEKDEKLITLQRLYESYTGNNLTKELYDLSTYKERLKYLVEAVEKITHIEDFGYYLSNIILIDALFLNDDRHLHNIAVIQKDNEFRLCPIFDNGSSLLSDTKVDYPLSAMTRELINNACAKTIGDSFDMALEACEELYGVNVTFYFDEKVIDEILSKVENYDIEIINRVRYVLTYQMNKHSYYFNHKKK